MIHFYLLMCTVARGIGGVRDEQGHDGFSAYRDDVEGGIDRVSMFRGCSRSTGMDGLMPAWMGQGDMWGIVPVVDL